MNEITFFTPIQYTTPHKSRTEWLLQKADGYFYHWGKKVYVIQGRTADGKEEVIVAEGQSSLLASALKVVTYFTVVIPLFLLLVKAGLRATHNFQQVTVRQKLAEGIDVSETTKSKIQELMSKIFTGQNDPEIESIKVRELDREFRLTASPNLVFKTVDVRDTFYTKDGTPLGSKGLIDKRFAKRVKAKEVCLVNRLDLLVVPPAVQFEVEVEGQQYPLIAEERPDYIDDDSAQEELYHTFSKQLNETVCQLATFVAKLGFCWITWGNNPVLNEDPTFKGSRRVALINLLYSSEFDGVCGKNGRGLTECVSEEQLDMVIAAARRAGEAISKTEASDAKASRLATLESNKRLKEFHERNSIVTGKEPLKVEIDTLGLDLSETVQRSFPSGQEFIITLKGAAEEVIQEINEKIQGRPDNASVKGKRNIFLGIPLCPDMDLRVLNALVEKGHIYEFKKLERGYSIQA